ncbi:MAG TPA: LCCL domain-containing protein, partial [Candidatus Paceibacterota bacterium]|nr:LCCL domain-containing protein [Candidatus Paceibacterota bacterium]
TGFGAVGPSTREALLRHLCVSPGKGQTTFTSASSSDATSTPPGANPVTLTATPNSGTSPLAVAFSASGVSPDGRYSLAYGDGSASGQFSGSFQGDSKNQNPWAHSYSSPGTYVATLTSYPTAQTNCANCPQPSPAVVGSVTVTVSSRSGSHPALEAVPTSGAVPLPVGFSVWVGGDSSTSTYTLDFGDGTAQFAPSCAAPGDACTAAGTASHTYAKPGTYTAKVILGARETGCTNLAGASCRPTGTTLGSVTIQATASSTALGTYVGYLDGSQFIDTDAISQADALANCKLNASQNPGHALRCTWNGSEIFSVAASLAAVPTITFSASASFVGSGLPVTLAWNATNAIGCSLSDGSSGLATAGSKTVNPATTTAYVLTCSNVSPGAATSSASKMVKVSVSALEVISSAVNAIARRGQNGQKFSYFCAPGASTGASVWGTSAYTDDSSICMAAVHAGVITDAGGPVTITIAGKRTSFVGSTRNGVTSASWGAWDGSFTVAKGPTADVGGGYSAGLANALAAVRSSWKVLSGWLGF